jgi:hypothetical protein
MILAASHRLLLSGSKIAIRAILISKSINNRHSRLRGNQVTYICSKQITLTLKQLVLQVLLYITYGFTNVSYGS